MEQKRTKPDKADKTVEPSAQKSTRSVIYQSE